MRKIFSILLIASIIVGAVCVNVSAVGYYLQERFNDGGSSFNKNFIAGAAWITDDSQLVGDRNTLTFMSRYDDSNGVFNDTMFTWLEYDAEIEICAIDDRAVDGSRDISLVYCNDNRVAAGIDEDRSFISFGYDFVKGEFYLTNCLGGGGEEDQLVARVGKEINEKVFNKFCISVTRGRIRGYFNGQLIIDFVDTDDTYKIAKKINSPFFFWNTGNFFSIKSIDISMPCYIYGPPQIISVSVKKDFKKYYVQGDSIDTTDGKLLAEYTNGATKVVPITPEMVTGFDSTKLGDQTLTISYGGKTCEFTVTVTRFVYGDLTGDGNVSVSDAILVLKHVAGWNITINEAAADVNCDGNVSVADAILILKFVANWNVVLGPTGE